MNPRVLGAMGDNISREMYQKRVAYGNGEQEAIEPIVNLVWGGVELLTFMQQNQNHLYVFGAGMIGQDLVETWDWKYTFQGFIDNDKEKQGKSIRGIPIMALEELGEKKEKAAIIIMNKFYHQEIARQLEKEGIAKEQVFNVGIFYRELNKAQYFDLEELEIVEGEKFVDCGVLDGETSLNLLEKYGNKIKKIWMFEPDKKNILKVKNNFKDQNVEYEIIGKGVWSSATTLKFQSLGNGCSGIDGSGEERIETISLDEALHGCGPTFIKMDIEGAELEALKGAEMIIRKYQPKLAISIYHKLEDIEEIPKLLLEYNPNYKFYIRHYSLMSSETILYAL